MDDGLSGWIISLYMRRVTLVARSFIFGVLILMLRAVPGNSQVPWPLCRELGRRLRRGFCGICGDGRFGRFRGLFLTFL